MSQSEGPTPERASADPVQTPSPEARRPHSPLVWMLAGACGILAALLIFAAGALWGKPERVSGTAQAIPAAATASATLTETSVKERPQVKVSEAPPRSREDIIARAKRSVVMIEVEGPEGVATGSGFPIDEDRVATCAHVVRDATQIKVVTGDGVQVAASVLDVDEQNDVALLRCGPGLPDPLELGAADEAREGEDVAITGFPVMDKLLELGYVPVASTSRGTVSAVRTRRTEAGVVQELQTDAAINPGNSGGPIYSLKSGKVLGLASARLTAESGIGFAAPVKALLALAGPETLMVKVQSRRTTPDSAALFAVSADGQLDTVLLMRRGKYVEPTHLPREGSTAAATTFDANYFQPGKVFTVVFGGADAGTAKVKGQGVQIGGVTFRGEAELNTTAPIRGALQALATDVPELLGATSTRRAPTKQEREAALAIARSAFARKGVTGGVTVQNLTAGDLDGDSVHELIGSFQVVRQERPQNLFLLLEADGSGGYKAVINELHLSKEEYGVDAEDQRVLDWLDLDGDGVSELVTKSGFYEWWEYKAYSRQGGKWSMVYEAHGGGS